ncbi:TRIC cation channel family protein [Lentibacillus sp. CBA3610]|uniref:TRIC cation channel family protein n=1 Tax=Lentibacillus sp. CBA3610 TaxID=2518176 RepID=UPI00350E4FF8
MLSSSRLLCFLIPDRVDPILENGILMRSGWLHLPYRGLPLLFKLVRPLSAVIVAATLTGCGGGMIRDVFAGRKPMIFREEIYALWRHLAG